MNIASYIRLCALSAQEKSDPEFTKALYADALTLHPTENEAKDKEERDKITFLLEEIFLASHVNTKDHI